MRCWMLALLMLAGCGHDLVPTLAEVARLEGDSFTACKVNLGWTPAELHEACGEPERVVRWKGHEGSEGECSIYRSSAQSFVGPAHAPRIAVCIDNGLLFSAGVGRLDPKAPRVVLAVFGLSAD